MIDVTVGKCAGIELEYDSLCVFANGYADRRQVDAFIGEFTDVNQGLITAGCLYQRQDSRRSVRKMLPNDLAWAADSLQKRQGNRLW